MIYLDFETYSPENIDHGVVKYANAVGADIICLTYAVDDGLVQLWEPSLPWPEVLNDKSHKLYAHNAGFDLVIWEVLAVKYGAVSRPLEDWIDTMGLCQRYTLPGALDKCCKILGTTLQKSAVGKKLIKQICVPTASGKRPQLHVDFTLEDLRLFYEYGKTDTASMKEVVYALPAQSLTPELQETWVMTQEMNLLGLPIDVVSAEAIYKYLEVYKEEMASIVPEVTDGYLNTVMQHAKLKKYLASVGCEVPNTQASTLDLQLLKSNLPEKAREIIELRQLLGGSATKKYVRLVEGSYLMRMHGTLCFYGAGTGRWAGRKFQLHNLPRASVKNPEAVIDQFVKFDPIERPMDMGKALVRPMISTTHLTNRSLLVADYAGIENCILPWFAGEEETLRSIRKGECQYSHMAATIYHTTYDVVRGEHKDGDSTKRTTGKIAELGCGFGMGYKRFKNDAEVNWGIRFSQEDSERIVKAYRSKHAVVVRSWYKLKDIVIAAISFPGTGYKYRGVRAKVLQDKSGRAWLQLTLPSNRALYYMEPFLEDGPYGLAPGHMGVNPKTKQWVRRRLIPGRIVENVVQGLAFDIMDHGLKQVRSNMPEANLIGTVHDEALAEVDSDKADLDKYIGLLCVLPKWAEGLPLKAEGFVTQRYRKG